MTVLVTTIMIMIVITLLLGKYALTEGRKIEENKKK